MKLRAFAAVLALGVLLSGCSSLMSREYIWTEPYQLPQSPEAGEQVSVSNYLQLQKTLTDMVEAGETYRTVSVASYKSQWLEEDVASAVDALRSSHPIGAYAVDQVNCEMGSIAGELVMVIRIGYRHDRVDVDSIEYVENIDAAKQAVANALKECQPGIVLHIQEYMLTDFAQMVEDYAMENPHIVMELPRVMESVYPEAGKTRVVELKLHYQSSRDALKTMQDKVAPVFSSAILYVSGDGAAYEKYSQLYTFLMERYEYTIETSITPAYSLLRHGVGDNKAFATVYAAMCRQAGLECIVVSGTREGQSWYWNIICHEGVYYHVDLLRCSKEGAFVVRSDGAMIGYVWDYSAYPPCGPW